MTHEQENLEKTLFHRLPTDVQPIHYEIFLTPNIEEFTYSGKQHIFINVTKATKSVVLNSVGIKIKTVLYNNTNKDILYAKNIEYNTLEEKVSINFDNEIPLGESGFLTFEFDGEINKKLIGFYQSKYISDGVTKFAFVTQFAPTDARRCFPCWDEPAIKATFDINLIIPKELTAISNMPIKSVIENESNLNNISFERTPRMSTYLVAFIICDYDFIENHEDNKKIRVYAPKNKIKYGEFSLDIAVKALPFYESYFDVPYPLSKIDLVTVADFSFGAMENWGLITYREAILLVDAENSSTDKKQKAALTIAHELAHQWFGNLVTMEWWTDLWLNEGYASFMEFLCIDHLHPEYNIWSQFLTTKYIKALELDALANTHPIEVPVGNPSEITEIFDQISYNKGASVIRMIHSYIGNEDFQKGMHLYLTKYSYSNVQTKDLWHALEEASNKPIGNIMSSWTKLSGFPLISIKEKNSSSPNKRVFNFSQERFFINGSRDKSNTTWIIPITLISNSDPKKILKVIILDEKTKDIEIDDIPKENWIKINAGTVGFFRTLYSDDLLKMLLPAIRNQSLTVFDRVGLLDDLFATAQAGRASTVEFLKLIKEFKNDTDYVVWYCIINNLRKISNILLHLEDTYHSFKTFGRNLLSEIYSKLGWMPKTNENHLNTLLRNLILSQMVEFDDEMVIAEAKHRFQLHITNQTILPADLCSVVYRAVLSSGNSDTFEKILSLYRNTDMHEEKNRILNYLGTVKDINILQRILEFSMSDEVRSQDAFYIIKSMTMNYKGRLLAWQYFKKNWKAFVNRYQSGTLLKNIVELLTESLVSEEIMLDIKEFFEKNPISGTERTIQQSIETIKLNLAWLNRDKALIEEFLESR